MNIAAIKYAPKKIFGVTGRNWDLNRYDTMQYDIYVHSKADEMASLV